MTVADPIVAEIVAGEAAEVALTAEFDAWLTETSLPAMSADELWFEMSAVQSGKASHFIAAEEEGAVTPERMAWIADFCARWDVAASRTDKAWQNATPAQRNAASEITDGRQA